jgi:hypothetical protein
MNSKEEIYVDFMKTALEMEYSTRPANHINLTIAVRPTNHKKEITQTPQRDKPGIRKIDI